MKDGLVILCLENAAISVSWIIRKQQIKKARKQYNRLQTLYFNGDGGIRTRPVMTTSIRLHNAKIIPQFQKIAIQKIKKYLENYFL